MKRLAVLVVGVALVGVETASAQFRPGGSGFPGGGGPGSSGGFRSGGFGVPRDPAGIFDYLAKGRPYFLISETRSYRDPLAAYAKSRGITNEQITREQFLDFYSKMEQFKTPGSSPFGARPGSPPSGAPATSSPSNPGTPSPTSSGSPPAFGQNPLEAIGQWGEADFKRRDQNGDGKLVPEEMSETLRGQIERWDTDRDGLINLDEYKVYYSARLQMRDGAPGGSNDSQRSNPLTILIEEDYDRRPDVIRVGKLPKELPKWFGELDGDQDGQVALHEWFKAGKEIDEFRDWDRNDDGLMTAEEVLFRQKTTATADSKSSPGNSPGSGERRDFGSRFGEGGGRPSFGGPPGFGGGSGFFRRKN